MSLASLCLRLLAVALAVLLSSCGGGGSSASPPTGGLTVTPGGNQVTLTWTATPGVDYWLLYAPTTAALDMTNPPANHVWRLSVTSPLVITGLANGTTYAFTINGRVSGGPGGTPTPTQFATPRPAGDSWTAVTSTANASTQFRSLMVGTDANSVTQYMAVGASGIYYSGDSQTWVQDTNAPTTSYTAGIYTLSTFIAASSSAPYISHTTVPLSWTSAATQPAGPVAALASNGSRVVAVGGSAVYFSDDAGANWSTGTISGTAPASLNGVTYNSTLGLFVAVGTGGAVLTSSDGASWTVGASAGTQNLNGVTSYGSYVVAVGNAGSVAISSSSSGLSWSVQTIGGGTASLKAATYDGVQWVAVGSAGTVLTSTDGATWVNDTNPSGAATGSGTANDLYAVIGSQVYYVMAGDNGTIRSAK